MTFRQAALLLLLLLLLSSVSSSTPHHHRRILIIGQERSGATLLAYFLGQVKKGAVIVLEAGESPPSPQDLFDVPAGTTVIVRALLDPEAPLPALVRTLRPHATVLFLRRPEDNYASLLAVAASGGSGVDSDSSVVDAQFRLLDRLFVVRERVFNATIFYEELTALRPILGPKLKVGEHHSDRIIITNHE